MSDDTPTARREQWQKRWDAVPDMWVPLVLTGFAFGGSFTHWIHQADTHGQAGWLALSVAISVDLGFYMSARERQHDIKIGRKRKGLAGWPTICMFGGLILTLLGNLAGAQRSTWGITDALIPGVHLLIAISYMERRSAYRARQAAQAAGERDEAEREARRERDEAERERERAAEAARAAARERRRQRGSERGSNDGDGDGSKRGSDDGSKDGSERGSNGGSNAAPRRVIGTDLVSRDAAVMAFLDKGETDGKAVGAEFGRSETWGRAKIRELRPDWYVQRERLAAQDGPAAGDGTPPVVGAEAPGTGQRPAAATVPPQAQRRD